MNQRNIVVILGVVVLVLGLALGFAGATQFGRDEESTSSGIQNAEIKVGDKAPEFELYDHTGAKVWLSDFREKKNAVLAFYPAAWTPV